jgi:hypothetical protein
METRATFILDLFSGRSSAPVGNRPIAPTEMKLRILQVDALLGSPSLSEAQVADGLAKDAK